MLKLARNVLCDKNLSSHSEISWNYLRYLHELQNELGFKFANRLSGVHINYKNKVMNVAVAAQTISSSTADAIEFLMKCGHPKFSGASSTIEYLRMIDRLFDLCNSRNPLAKGFKTPLNLYNKDWWNKVFDESVAYLENLNICGIPVIKTPRKMFAIGFIATIKSLKALATELLSREVNPLNYVLTYKFSQDHIELFFSSIRACGGFNNNPNACQFRWALRKLLLSSNISVRNSNCLNNGVEIPSTILEFRSEKRAVIEAKETDYEVLCSYARYLDSEFLSIYQRHILYHIGGYIVKNIIAKCSCINCVKMLVDENCFHNYSKINSLI